MSKFRVGVSVLVNLVCLSLAKTGTFSIVAVIRLITGLKRVSFKPGQ